MHRTRNRFWTVILALVMCFGGVTAAAQAAPAPAVAGAAQAIQAPVMPNVAPAGGWVGSCRSLSQCGTVTNVASSQNMVTVVKHWPAEWRQYQWVTLPSFTGVHPDKITNLSPGFSAGFTDGYDYDGWCIRAGEHARVYDLRSEWYVFGQFDGWCKQLDTGYAELYVLPYN